MLQVPRTWHKSLPYSLWRWRPSGVPFPNRWLTFCSLGSFPRITLSPELPPPKKTRLTLSLLSFPGVTHRLRHVRGQP